MQAERVLALLLVQLAAHRRNQYAAADRDRFAAAAEAIVAENNTPAIVGVLSAAGILLISIVMTRRVLPRAVAWLGVLTGALGVLREALRHVAPLLYGGYGVLLWAWFIAVGIALIRLGRRTPQSTAG